MRGRAKAAGLGCSRRFAGHGRGRVERDTLLQARAHLARASKPKDAVMCAINSPRKLNGACLLPPCRDLSSVDFLHCTGLTLCYIGSLNCYCC